MSASQPSEDQDMDSSVTQTTELPSEGPSSSSPSQRDTKSRISVPLLSPYPTSPPVSLSGAAAPSSEHSSVSNSSAPVRVSSPLPGDINASETKRKGSTAGSTGRESRTEEDLKPPVSVPFPGFLRTAEETVQFVTSLQSGGGLNPQVETFGSDSGLTCQLNLRPTGFISSEQLQEILQELSVDAVTETALRSPGQASRAPSQLKLTKLPTLSPPSIRSPCSPHPPVFFRYPSISPYSMRKRRPPFHSSRRGLAPPCFYIGSDIPVCGKKANCKHQTPGKHPEGLTVDDELLQVQRGELEVERGEEDDAEGEEVDRKCQRCLSSCHGLRCAEEKHTAPPDVEVGGDNERHHKHIRDSCGYWDSDSSSSTDYCYYHRPYCESCLQRGSILCSDSSSDSSDSEYDSYTGLYRSPRPVVFKEDLKPTFV